MDFVTASAWLSAALLTLPVLYLVLRTHRERTTAWWNALSVGGTPNVPWLLGLMWLMFTASGGLALPVLVWTSSEQSPDTALWRAMYVLSTLAATILYVLWPTVLLVSHGHGYAVLFGTLQWLLTLAAHILFAVAAHQGIASVGAAILYAAHTLWSTYIFGVSWAVWGRRGRLTPTHTRYADYNYQASPSSSSNVTLSSLV